ncbi:MAG: GNAT family N-acetyltransferase [Clostridia bacterium]|nr:GNAT family N-acetyltransferase [Clostridia bacterium]
MIALERITKDNIFLYSSYEKTDVIKYQSRIYPDENADAKLWYYIKYDDLYIGSVWVEKAKENDFAVLGIFIADDSYRNKGIGLEAIKMILGLANTLDVERVLLRVREDNKRALKCYQKAGFIEVDRYVKDNGVRAVEMMYRLE